MGANAWARGGGAGGGRARGRARARAHFGWSGGRGRGMILVGTRFPRQALLSALVIDHLNESDESDDAE
jgi:hypothetical protein